MPAVTGIEVGPESWVLARVRATALSHVQRRRAGVQLSAVCGLNDRDWDPAQTAAQNLADARRRGRFPRTARAVIWGLHESASKDDALAMGPVAPLRDAGFRIDAAMSPAQALLALSSRCPRYAEGAIVWLALNRHRVAIAIIESGRLLYSREFDWQYRPAVTAKQKLLQRYSLVAHLALEVRHALDVVRARHGVTAGRIMTCGNLPDLPSLTMPLIVELEIEVETLDTLEGFDLDASVDGEIVAEKASALYLAMAAGAGESHQQAARRWLAGAAAAVVVTLLLIGGWLTRRSSHGPPDMGGVAAPLPPVQQPQPAATPAPAPVEPPAQAPEASTAAATTGHQDPRGQKPAPSATTPFRRKGREADLQPLRDPLPVVNSIMVAPDRRLAVVAGEIVREGDAIGRRVLVRIERDNLVLREPSGHEVRVYFRRRAAFDQARGPG